MHIACYKCQKTPKTARKVKSLMSRIKKKVKSIDKALKPFFIQKDMNRKTF